MTKRIFLSPHVSGRELDYLGEALRSNWIAPLGPMVDAFEKEVCGYVGVEHGVALSSGTAALHLAILIAGVQGGRCALRDVDLQRHCQCDRLRGSSSRIHRLRPNLLEYRSRSSPELSSRAASGRKAAAVVAVDLYGQCADYDRIEATCRDYSVPLIEDAAEALGATYKGRRAGSFGKMAVFSFNGNKIITTAGGGMLVSNEKTVIDKARFLATQARDPAPHYQHSTIGYNYRMSNLLAAVGQGQLELIKERILSRRKIFDYYRSALRKYKRHQLHARGRLWTRKSMANLRSRRAGRFWRNKGRCSACFGSGCWKAGPSGNPCAVRPSQGMPC